MSGRRPSSTMWDIIPSLRVSSETLSITCIAPWVARRCCTGPVAGWGASRRASAGPPVRVVT
jgi:hypothetical protein